METLLTKMVVFLLCFCGPYTAFGQSTTIKSTTGNGPILSGLKITNAEAVGNLREFGTMTSTPTTGSDRVDVRFSLSGKISEYRYNGKTYNTEYLDCYIMCGDCKQEKVKITATVKYGNKTITQSGVKINAVGKLHLNIELPAIVKRNTISLVSLVVEPVAYPQYEAQLDKLKKCEEEKEKKKKEAAKKQTANTDDDFWNGGEKETEQRKIVLSGSNDDFWSGKEEEKKEEKVVVKEEKKKQLENEEYYYEFILFPVLHYPITYITNIFKVKGPIYKYKLKTQRADFKYDDDEHQEYIENISKLLYLGNQFVKEKLDRDVVLTRGELFNTISIGVQTEQQVIELWQYYKNLSIDNKQHYILCEGFYPFGK